MNRINIGNGGLSASEISLGCMRITDLSKKDKIKNKGVF